MIHRPPIPESLFSDQVDRFDQWQVRAKLATEQACASFGRNCEYDAKVYGALKPALKAHFDGKCAYCEAYFDHVAFGDVEHFRPKKRVDEDDAKDHPGYFWLAYEPSNLLPACAKCNQPFKRNRFPIAGVRAKAPKDDLTAESPLLLNPYEATDFTPAPKPIEERDRLLVARTSIHLGFDFEIDDYRLSPTGTMRGFTDQGCFSIEIYGLNRSPLVKYRRDRQDAAIAKFESRYFREKFQTMIKDLTDSAQDSSAAIRATFQAWKWVQQQKLGSID